MKKNTKLSKNNKAFLALLLFTGILGAKVTVAQWDPNTLSQFDLPDSSIYFIIRNILNWLLAVLGFIGVIGFVISGIMYLTAAGDETQAEKAKKAMTYSIIGVIVGLSGLVVIWAVDSMLFGASFF